MAESPATLKPAPDDASVAAGREEGGLASPGPVDGLAERFGVRTREVDRAMHSIDDTISDLASEVETELNDEVDRLGDAA